MPKKVEDNPWYKNPYIIFPAVISLICAFITAPWWTDLLKSSKQSSFDSRRNLSASSQSAQASPFFSSTSSTSQKNVRALQPLETGKKIGDLPNNVYFYLPASWIEEEVKDPNEDFLEVSSQDGASKFELQKIDNRYYLLGFISDEAKSKIGSISKESIFTQLFPNRWSGADNLIAIPFDAVYSIKYREINLDEVKSVRILDVGFKEVVENPEFHKTVEL